MMVIRIEMQRVRLEDFYFGIILQLCVSQKQVKYVCSEYLEESKRYQRSCGETCERRVRKGRFDS